MHCADRQGASKYMDDNLGWWADPIYFGDYPASLKVNWLALPQWASHWHCTLHLLPVHSVNKAHVMSGYGVLHTEPSQQVTSCTVMCKS